MSIKQEILELITAEVTQFKDFETYELFENTTKQEFISNLQLGLYIDLTLSSYNGHSNQFAPRSITNDHIYDSIVNHLWLTEYADLSHITENLTDPELVYEFVSNYNVFTLNNRIYLNYKKEGG